MKKVIIGTLAVIGGLTVAVTALTSISAVVQARKERKTLENMTPEQREAFEKKRAAVINALVAALSASVVDETEDAASGEAN